MMQRRDMMVGGALLGAAAVAAPVLGRPARVGIVNPVVRQRADAQVFRHTDGWYYMTASVPEYDRLVLRRARTLGGLGKGEEIVVWRRPASGKIRRHAVAREAGKCR